MESEAAGLEFHAAGEALMKAHALGDLVGAAEIVDRWGVDLAHTSFAGALYDIVADLPPELGTARPGLAFRLEDIGRLPIGTTPLGLPENAEEARIECARNGDLRLRQSLLPLTTRRRLGRYVEATSIVRAAAPLAAACAYPWYGGRSQILPYWHLQAGITLQLAGDLQDAQHHFLEGWTHRARDPYGFVARDLAAKLALQHAFLGERAACDVWFDRALAAERRTDLWVDHFVESSLGMVTLIQAVDQLDPDSSSRLAATLHPGQSTGLWPLLMYIFVQHALAHGDPSKALRHLEDSVDARPRALAGTGLAGALVPLVRGEIHLALGQGHQALTSIEGSDEVAGLTLALRARILVLAGQPSAALAQVAELKVRRDTCPRALAEGLLAAAAAHLAVGDREAAVRAAADAVKRVKEQEALRLLGKVPRAALATLAPEVPGLGSLLAALETTSGEDRHPSPVQLILTTERERDLLRELNTDRTLAQIAAANYVSVNTVRTHLANLRRKLDARSREEVVTKARQLGLLEDPQ